MTPFLQMTVAGIALGCVYGLIALGFALVYKATETINFAQSDLMMLGAFIAFACMGLFGMPFWFAALVAVVLVALIGYLLERAVIRPILGQPQFSIVMLTFGIGYVLRGGITMMPGIGTDTHVLDVPYKGRSLELGPVILGAEQLMVMAVMTALCAVLWLVFRFTRVGIAMQAASQNQLAAYYMGIPVQRLNGLAWALAGLLAAIAGLLLAPITFVHANMGFIGLKALPAAIVGGFGSLPGAVVGGLIIGATESLSGFYLPEGFKDAMPYAVVLLVLAIKPTGLFGGHARKKV